MGKREAAFCRERQKISEIAASATGLQGRACLASARCRLVRATRGCRTVQETRRRFPGRIIVEEMNAPRYHLNRQFAPKELGGGSGVRLVIPRGMDWPTLSPRHKSGGLRDRRGDLRRPPGSSRFRPALGKRTQIHRIRRLHRRRQSPDRRHRPRPPFRHRGDGGLLPSSRQGQRGYHPLGPRTVGPLAAGRRRVRQGCGWGKCPHDVPDEYRWKTIIRDTMIRSAAAAKEVMVSELFFSLSFFFYDSFPAPLHRR